MVEKRLVVATQSSSFLLTLATASVLAIKPATCTVAAEHFVASAAQISTAMQTAQPGDVLVMADGDWTNQRIRFEGFGTSAAPITLRAETPGQVVLGGNSKINISGSWLVVDGLRFEGGALGEGEHLVEFRGTKGEATNSRLTNSTIIDYNPADINTRYFWVSLYGQHNRVDHNYFENQNHSGVTVVVWRDNGPDHHTIDANYFGPRPVGNGNGWETIRVGTSDSSLSDSFTTVENNLFERTNGEVEAISNKSGNNVFRYNTFRETSATLTLRHGNDNRVEGNFFLGEGANGSGAIRVIGERQSIVNNYIANVDDRAGGAISISAGVPNSALNQYFQVKDALIAHNTIVDVAGPAITFDDGLGSSGRTLLAENVTVANNLLRSSGPAIFEGNEGSGWTWDGNIAFGGSFGPASGNPGVAAINPQLQFSADGLWRPAPTSPAINSASGNYTSLITDDMDGQPRIGIYDVGADEASDASIVRRPLSANDVGPDWLFNEPPQPTPGGGGCKVAGCALQAEAFTAIRDPDMDGRIWTKASVAEALGGQVIKAPSGSLIDVPAMAHETIAVYEMTFETAGTYTAYYRARGFNGSSDSIYTPDDFGVDPDNSDSLTMDGNFRWEKDPRAFTISPSHVGMPLEFRLGMRESLAEIDALVLHLNAALTSAQLDNLFTVLPGDYNGDGVVDAADYVVWRDAFGSDSLLAADGSGNGIVDDADYTLWKTSFGSMLRSSTSSPTAVPEPATLFLTTFGALTFVRTWTRGAW